jgi:CDP-6-deoxy-D-xylo-4-hexulose-3-dehydrase
VFGELKNTDKIMKDTFWIGVWPGIGEKKSEYIVKIFKEFIDLNILYNKLEFR